MSCDSKSVLAGGCWFTSYLKEKKDKYGIPEAVAITGAAVLAFIFWKTKAKSLPWLTVIADFSEYVLFYGAIILQSVVRSPKTDSAGIVFWRGVKAAISAAKGEGSDFYLRPTIIAISISLTPDYEFIGIIVGKVVADIPFYLSMDISGYLWKKRKDICNYLTVHFVAST